MSRRGAAVLLAGALAVVVLALLLRGADLAALGAAASALPAWGWLAAIAGLLASYGLRALRLQTEWGPRVAARFLDCLHLMLVHNAAVNLLPMRAGEAGYPWLLHRRFGVPVGDAAASLLRLRLQDAMLLALLAIALLVPHGAALAAVAALGAVAAWLGAAPIFAAAALPRVDDGRIARALRRTLRLLFAPRQSRVPAWWSWACAAANWAVKIAALGGLLAALAHVSIESGLRGALGGELAAVLPLQAPAGLGSYEGGVWAAVALHDRSALAQLGVAALAVHLLALAVGLVAAALVHATRSGTTALATQGETP